MGPGERDGSSPRYRRRGGKREPDLSEEKKRGPEARPTAGGFGQAHVGSFDSTRRGLWHGRARARRKATRGEVKTKGRGRRESVREGKRRSSLPV